MTRLLQIFFRSMLRRGKIFWSWSRRI